MELINFLSWLGGFIIALITIYLTIRHFKTTKTISYIERLKTGELFYPMIPTYWKDLFFYIKYKRGKGYPIGYYFEYLSKEVRKTEGKNKSTLLKRYSHIS